MAGRAALALVATLVALALGELVARLATPAQRGIAWHHYDARYGHRHRAGLDADTDVWGDGARWHVRTNALGFRGGEWSARTEPGERRVLLAGDSFVFGHGLDEDRTIGAQAERAATGWTIRNLGASGWGPQNALGYLETEGEAIEASCLVYVVYEGNDALDGLLRPVYEARDGRWVRRPPTPPPRGWVGSLRAWARANPAHDWLVEHSQLYNVVRRGVMTRAQQADGVGAAIPEGVSERERERLVADHVRTLERMESVARARFGGFALVLVPMRAQLDPASRDAEEVRLAELTHARTLAFAGERGVPVLDLRRAMEDDPGGPSSFYFRRDFHLAPAGARFVGARLGRRIEDLCASGPGD